MATKKSNDIPVPETSRMHSEIPPPPKSSFYRGLGHKVDSEDPRDFTAKQLLGAARNLPGEASLEDHLRRIKDQGDTESCVGQALATAIDTRLRMANVSSPEPSSLAIYAFARSLARLSPDEPLADTGSFPRVAMKGVRDWGVPPESAWPFDTGQVDTELPWDVMQAASAARIVSWYRVEGQGLGRVQDIQHALAQGYPVVFGTAVDKAFMEHTGKAIVRARTGASQGGHMMAILGYRVEGVEVLFRCVNSWGNTWGDNGLYWAGEDFIRSADAADFYAMAVVGG